eukprot:m.498405 g.498405  ORF g.498405 m.498405 type:complete len:79 (+) comp158823_c0_seq1:38-274(+)
MSVVIRVVCAGVAQWLGAAQAGRRSTLRISTKVQAQYHENMAITVDSPQAHTSCPPSLENYGKGLPCYSAVTQYYPLL